VPGRPENPDRRAALPGAQRGTATRHHGGICGRGRGDQAGLTGLEALERAFDKAQNHNAEWAARSMQPGDVMGLDDGPLYRLEMDGWTEIGKAWVA
jgi:hypothetical protein